LSVVFCRVAGSVVFAGVAVVAGFGGEGFRLGIDSCIDAAHTRHMTNTDSAFAAIIEQALAFIASKSTAELLDMLDLIEGQNDESDRMTRCGIFDTLAQRHNLNPVLDSIMFGDVEFVGTARELIELAISVIN
jgi:hypothetical protein